MPSSTELENLRASKRFITKCWRRKFFFFFASKTWKHVTFSILQWKVVLRSPCYYEQSFLSRQNARSFQEKTPLMVVNPVTPLIRPSATFWKPNLCNDKTFIIYSVNTATHTSYVHLYIVNTVSTDCCFIFVKKSFFRLAIVVYLLRRHLEMSSHETVWYWFASS